MNVSSIAPAPPGLEQGLAEARGLAARGDHQGALTHLETLETRFPQSGLLWQERGACRRALGDAAAALLAYERAVALNDALPGSWQALIELRGAAGQSAGAAEAARCLARLKALPADLARGSSALNEGELESAEQLIRGYLRAHGNHIEGMRLLAQLAIKRDVLDDAELLLENVLRLAPDNRDAAYEYGMVLLERRHFLAALREARHLLQSSPGNGDYKLLYARSCDGLGESDEALRVYRELLAERPADATLQLLIASALQVRGDGAAAIEWFQRAAAASPTGLATAALSLANTSGYRFSDAELERMRAQEAAPSTPLPERYRLGFALGKALEDRREYAESFAYYARANELKRSEHRYRPELADRQAQLLRSVCTREFLAARSGGGCPRPDPIFVLGLPRSGSTLIEQILASHSQVDGTLELPGIPHLVQQFRTRGGPDAAPRYPGVLGELTDAQLRQLGEIYLEECQPYRRGAPFFVDKMLSNYRDVGFIHLILPNAKIIDARREPMACCFGNFRQLFVRGQDFSYSLEDLGHHYRSYVSVMEHWDAVLPGKVLRVQHEDVVNDLEGSVRRILAFCGLPYEAACLEFYRTARSVRTISATQVRRPIFRSGLDQWRNFEPWLEPLKRALGPLAPRG